MWSFSTPPPPDIRPVTRANKAMVNHISSFEDVEKSIDNLFLNCVTKLAIESPETLQNSYSILMKIGDRISASFKVFINGFQPIMESGRSLINKHDALAEALSKYQKELVAVRKDETPESLEKEKEALMAFVAQLEAFNQNANSIQLSILMLYISCMQQFNFDLKSIASSIGQELDNWKTPPPSQEEVAITDFIEKIGAEMDAAPIETPKSSPVETAKGDPLTDSAATVPEAPHSAPPVESDAGGNGASPPSPPTQSAGGESVAVNPAEASPDPTSSATTQNK